MTKGDPFLTMEKEGREGKADTSDQPLIRVSEDSYKVVTFFARVVLCMAVVFMTSFSATFAAMGYPTITAIVDMGAGLLLFVLLLTWIK
jgi:hypothetical protein